MRVLTAVVAVSILAATSCAGSHGPGTFRSISPQADSAASAHASTLTWPTYHATNSRSGQAATPITPPLHQGWAATLDGAVYGEALYVKGTVIAATENDSVYGLSPKTGHVKWRTHLGTPESESDLHNGLPSDCGDVLPLGITGTPAYDAKTGSVFVVAETLGGHHRLWALKATNGHRRWHKSMDVVKGRERRDEQQRSALLVSGGRVFTSYGGLSGDCGNYVGYTTSTPTTGKGKTRHYEVPTAREAGMWSPAGPVEGANGNIYVASGNGAELHGKWDKSDSVTELNPTTMHRIAVFAPSQWRQDNSSDLDLGSSSPVPVAHRIVIAGKRGVVYLLKPGLGGVGGQIRSLSGCSGGAYGGAAHRGHLVLMPCHDGIRALRVGKHSLHWRWTASGIYGSPVIAGHRVYVADSPSGDVKVLALSSGHAVDSISVGNLTHFPSATLVGNDIFVPSLQGITDFRGAS
jgi:outer membrane protein assembly factor BamB